jgi:hypothetical protein
MQKLFVTDQFFGREAKKIVNDPTQVAGRVTNVICQTIYRPEIVEVIGKKQGAQPL